MRGISGYDSDEERKPAQGAGPAAKRPRTAGPEVAGPARPPQSKKSKLDAQKLKELRKEVSSAKSATAVVNVIRRNLDSCWDVRWGAEALYQVAKRSTARTRQEWAEDRAIKKIGEMLAQEAETGSAVLAAKEEGGADLILLILDALRRMSLQEPQSQKAAIERAISLMVANKWAHPAKSLARLYFLAAPLSAEGGIKEHFSSAALPALLRQRQAELDGPDLALLLASLRGPQGLKDAGVLSKVVIRLKSKEIHKGLAATDLVEMAESLQENGCRDEEALRPLGQEALRRRGELTPDESHRIHAAYQEMKLPLPKVWEAAGSMKKDQNKRGIVTTQAFAVQEGHEKKRRGNNDIERTSPPRVVRDYKMCSY